MCWGCRPSCGNCKPPLEFYITCSQCGHPATITREQYLMYFDLPHKKTEKEKAMRDAWDGSMRVCAECGKSLADEMQDVITPQNCIRSGIVCGYPCGLHDSALPQGSALCTRMVPLGKYVPDNSEGGELDHG